MADSTEITAETFVDLLTPQSATLCPTGDRVIYSTTTVGRKGKHQLSSLWLADTSKEYSARQITSGLFNDRSPQWNPAGDAVAFLSDRHEASESCTIYLQHMSVGEPVPLTNVDAKKDILAYAWSPNGDYIAFLSADEKSAEEEAKEKVGDDATVHGKHWKNARLRLLHVESRAVTVLVQCDMHVGEFGWSQDSSRIVYTLREDTVFDTPVNPNGMGIRFETVDIADGKRQHVLDFPGIVIPDSSGAAALVWTEMGVRFMAPGDPRSCASSWRVWSLDVEAKEYERIAYGEVNDAYGRLAGGKDWVASVVLEGLEDSVRIVGGETLYAGQEELGAWDVAKTHEGQYAAVVVTSNVAKPPEVYSVDTKTAKKRLQLSNHGEAITAAQIGTAHTLSCKSYDNNFTLQAIYATPGPSHPGTKPPKPLPTLVFVHGGPYARSTAGFQLPYYPWVPFVLASGKYGILYANYRGNSSQGDAFAGAVRGTSGTLEHDDILALVDAGIAGGYIDGENVLIGGWSYGGVMSFMAAVLNGRTYAGEPKSWRYKGAIPGAGVCDQEMMSMSSDHIYYSTQMPGSNAWTSDWATQTDGRKGSAVWRVKEAVERGAGTIPPCLILHGEADDRVPVFQSWAFQRALAWYGVGHVMVTYPREGHLIEERGHLVDMLGRVGGWCDEHIGGGTG